MRDDGKLERLRRPPRKVQSRGTEHTLHGALQSRRIPAHVSSRLRPRCACRMHDVIGYIGAVLSRRGGAPRASYWLLLGRGRERADFMASPSSEYSLAQEGDPEESPDRPKKKKKKARRRDSFAFRHGLGSQMTRSFPACWRGPLFSERQRAQTVLRGGERGSDLGHDRC